MKCLRKLIGGLSACSRRRTAGAWLALAVLSGAGPLHALESTSFKDVIAANGLGDIDMFRTRSTDRVVNGAILEAFRQDNNGDLVFAIDVNEAASGSEKASSQGIAIAEAYLVLNDSQGQHTYTQFSTRTQTLVTEMGSSERRIYYTVLGDTGSNRVTGSSTSDIYGSSFDATLRFTVDHDLSAVDSAQLVVRFLDTDVSLGDPEAFYDFSNGYENVAIVTAADAAYLDELAPGSGEAPLVLLANETVAGSRVYYPSQNGYYVAAYEDLFPNKGDYDFNDLVVAYRVYAELDNTGVIVAVGGEGYLVARGAGGYDHDWHLRIPLPGAASGSGQIALYDPLQLVPRTGNPRPISFTGALDITVYTNTRQLWQDSGFQHVNTLPDQSMIPGHRFSFSVQLDTPLAHEQFPAPPFDPYLYVHDTAYEIHLAGQSPVLMNSRNTLDGRTVFRDDNGYPFALILPEDWVVPLEYVDLGRAYPDFVDFVVSGNLQNTDWFLFNDAARTKPLVPAVWKW